MYLYTRMEIEQWNSPKREKVDEGEWWRGESEKGMLLACIEMSQWNNEHSPIQLIYANKKC
jgi:hypothetical protein